MTDARAVRLLVEAGAVARFRAATGLPPDPDARFAPPSFPTTVEHAGAVFAGLLAERGIDLRRVLHGEERVDYPDGPLRIGEELVGEMTALGEEERAGGEGPLRLVTVRLELRRGDGSVAVRVDRVMVVLEAQVLEERPA